MRTRSGEASRWRVAIRSGSNCKVSLLGRRRSNVKPRLSKDVDLPSGADARDAVLREALESAVFRATMVAIARSFDRSCTVPRRVATSRILLGQTGACSSFRSSR